VQCCRKTIQKRRFVVWDEDPFSDENLNHEGHEDRFITKNTKVL
jgi:hypothetical protein